MNLVRHTDFNKILLGSQCCIKKEETEKCDWNRLKQYAVVRANLEGSSRVVKVGNTNTIFSIVIYQNYLT